MIKEQAVIQTKAGKLGGEKINGIYRFIGCRYAEPTGGANRFMPPQPLIPWEGIRPATSYAPKCWQTDTPRMEDPEIRCTRYPADYEKLMTGTAEMAAGAQSEDCCAVNVWTPGLRDGKKRPILVWFHGGGNIAGGAEANWHDGFNQARKQDVVMCSVGHRLGIFGYLYLGDYSDKYKKSANCGHQDMVQALKWIKDNAEELGGDPNNITIFGQSGGGGKVAALMSMPMAKGTVHKAIIQSGGFRINTMAEGTEVAKQLLDYLGITKENIDDIQTKYTAAELIQATREINATRTVGTYFVCPLIQDPDVLPYDPFDGAEGSAFCKDIPLITGYCKDDAKLQALFDPPLFKMTYEELPAKIMSLGYTAEQADAMIKYYRESYGESCTPCDCYCNLANDRQHLLGTIDRYESRQKVGGGAPVYNYVFCREGTDAEMRAIHGVEIPFIFDNACYGPALWDAETHFEAMEFSEACGATWAAFARTGNPSNEKLGIWFPYDSENRYTMKMDIESELVSDYRKPIREMIQK